MAADDRLSGARKLGVLNGVRIFGNSVGSRDKNDYYAFTLTGRSSFNLLLILPRVIDFCFLRGKISSVLSVVRPLIKLAFSAEDIEHRTGLTHTFLNN